MYHGDVREEISGDETTGKRPLWFSIAEEESMLYGDAESAFMSTYRAERDLILLNFNWWTHRRHNEKPKIKEYVDGMLSYGTGGEMPEFEDWQDNDAEEWEDVVLKFTRLRFPPDVEIRDIPGEPLEKDSFAQYLCDCFRKFEEDPDYRGGVLDAVLRIDGFTSMETLGRPELALCRPLDGRLELETLEEVEFEDPILPDTPDDPFEYRPKRNPLVSDWNKSAPKIDDRYEDLNSAFVAQSGESVLRSMKTLGYLG